MNIFEIRIRLSSVLLLTQVSLLVFALLVPLISNPKAYAAQLTTRSVTITTSKPSASSVTYTYGFTTATSAAIQSMSFQACTTPLGTCTSPGGTVSMNAGSEASRSGWTNATTFTRDATGAGSCTAAVNMLCIKRTQAASETAGARTLGWDTQTNPTAVASYYIRIISYSDTGWTTAVDNGTVAYAIVNQLTINAVVQEVLQFCVGTTTANDATTSPGSDCTAISGTSVDLGTVDSSATISASPVAASPNGGNAVNGVAMVRTNANNGTTVSYFAEQNTSSGSLKVAGASCGSTTYASGSTTDQCFNSRGATQGAITGGTEAFGMTIAGINCGSTTSYSCVFTSNTNNLKQAANYTGNTSTAYCSNGQTCNYAWVDTGSTTTIASTTGSTKVLDDEALILRFAATAAATTPTGSYTVTSTYVATPTF